MCLIYHFLSPQLVLPEQLSGGNVSSTGYPNGGQVMSPQSESNPSARFVNLCVHLVCVRVFVYAHVYKLSMAKKYH